MPNLITRTRARAEKFAGISRTAFWRQERRDPSFPRPVTVGSREFFVLEELDDYIARCVADRDADSHTKE